MKLPEITARHYATLMARGPLPTGEGEEVALGPWEWVEACDLMPTADVAHQLPGGAESGLFVVQSAAIKFTDDVQWFFGSVRLLIGLRDYFELDCGLFPIRFGGRIAIPSQQHLCAYVRDWGFNGNVPHEEGAQIELRLSGEWGTELK